MSQPIVFISRSRLTPGMRSELVARLGDVLDAMAATRPRTALMAAYLDETGTEMSIVHVFPDAAAMTEHFVGSDDRTASVADVITLIGFEVYGAAPQAAVEQLRREAADGGFELLIRAEPIGGFIRP